MINMQGFLCKNSNPTDPKLKSSTWFTIAVIFQSLSIYTSKKQDFLSYRPYLINHKFSNFYFLNTLKIQHILPIPMVQNTINLPLNQRSAS